MKKLFLPMVALFCSATAMAQDGFKPVAGNVTLEANVNLLGGTVNLNNSLNQVKVRYFLADDMAIRFGLGLGMNTDKNVMNGDSSWTEDKMTSWSISPGIEKHFAGTDRLSPYAGLDITIGGTNYEGESNDITVTGSGSSTTTTTTTGTYEGMTSSGTRANSTLGINLLAGCDFYFAKRIYLGYEIGLGFWSTKDKEFSSSSTTTVVSGSTTTTTTVDMNSDDNEGMKMSGISANVRNGIRFGFCF
jgi:hypothetical protein